MSPNLLYVKQKYASQIEMIDEKQQSLILEHLNEYNPDKQVVAFYQGTVILSDIFKAIGKTCEDYLKNLQKNKPPKRR